MNQSLNEFEMETHLMAETYGHRLNVAFSDYVARVEAGTGKPVTGQLLESLAANYALEAAKDVTARIMENSGKLDRNSSRPIEFSISKRRIDSAWEEMMNNFEMFPSEKFKEGLNRLLNTLSTPTEAELVSAEVVGDKKMIVRTTSDYKEIKTFLETTI
jgi:hypothetical protein